MSADQRTRVPVLIQAELRDSPPVTRTESPHSPPTWRLFCSRTKCSIWSGERRSSELLCLSSTSAATAASSALWNACLTRYVAAFAVLSSSASRYFVISSVCSLGGGRVVSSFSCAVRLSHPSVNAIPKLSSSDWLRLTGGFRWRMPDT